MFDGRCVSGERPAGLDTGRLQSVHDALLIDAVARFTPPGLADVSEIVVRDWGDETWARGAAAMALRELYGAPWSTTGPARPQQLNA